jgi:glutaminyl-peptide cyclotransferase
MNRTGYRCLLLFAAFAYAGCGGDSRSGYSYDPATAVHSDFSGEAAFQLLEKVTDFGPRPAGSDALENSRQWMEQTLKKSGWTVQRQTFTDDTPQGPIEFVNLRARFVAGDGLGGAVATDDELLWQRPTQVLLASHYDTKFYQTIAFVGANDPSSSIAALLEIARVAAQKPALAERLELVFFDGEEAFVSYTPSDGLFGSRHYAKQYRKWPDEMQFEAGILLDMVGDKDLNVRIPSNSPNHLTTHLLAAATELGTRKFFGTSSTAITDDHVPLNGVGLPTIDVIDFDYQHWHTSGDTIDKLSAESLETVGEAVLLMVEKFVLGDGES